MTHDCDHQGHVWLAENEKPYTRQRGKDLNATVDVHCQHCPASRLLPKFSQFSGHTLPGHVPDAPNVIPPQFKKVVDRAVAEAARVRAPRIVHHGSVPKSE